MKMDDYIKREQAVTVFKTFYGKPLSIMLEALAEEPAADVVPVRHGRWLIKNIRGDKRTVCSECLLETGTCYEENFCPNCGADMRGGKNDRT